MGTEGAVLGVDASEGTLGQAKARMKRHRWAQMFVGQADSHAIDAATLEQIRGLPVGSTAGNSYSPRG